MSKLNNIIKTKIIMEKKFNIISPDGFPIHHENTYTNEEVLPAFNEWKKRFINQGYYSSAKFGRIPLDDLQDYCTVKELGQV